MVGDHDDFLSRLRTQLPVRWFPDAAPILTGVLAGFASAWASVYGLLAFTRLQARISTAMGAFLDFIATDFFGTMLRRRAIEADTPFRVRLLRELLRPRVTRAAMISALFDLTGRTPIVFEAARPGDTGSWGQGPTGQVVGTGMAYNRQGGWGSLTLPFQAFITAFRPSGGGIANIGGFYAGSGWAGGGYSVGSLAYISADQVISAIPDAEIYAVIERTKPAGTTMWTAISP